jgi:hypothetical protein
MELRTPKFGDRVAIPRHAYVTILIWWAFVIYTTIHINHQKNASKSVDQIPSRYMSQGRF